MRLHYLQHVPFENPGSILTWAAQNDCAVTHTHVYREACFPEQDAFDWLVVMGGPMNIHEEVRYPWLVAEKAFIRESIESGKVVVGLCLGAQLLADVLGGSVTQNPQREIGWFPVRLLDTAREHPLFDFFPKHPTVFQWHGDTFDVLPDGATLLVEGDVCQNQAFVYDGRVFGFQYHLENTASIIEDLIENCGDELTPTAYVQTAEELRSHPAYIEQDNAWMSTFLSKLMTLYEEDGL